MTNKCNSKGTMKLYYLLKNDIKCTIEIQLFTLSLNDIRVFFD